MSTQGISPALEPKKSSNSTKWFFRAAGFGAGVAFALFLVAAIVLWYSSRPKPPQPPAPWNSSAFTAEYWNVMPEGEKNQLVFYYNVTNNTDRDYQLQSDSGIWITAHLKSQDGLGTFAGKDVVTAYPVFIPAHHKVLLGIQVPYYYPERAKAELVDEELKEFRAEVARYATREFTNLDGFAWFDENNRYEIRFPSGWQERAKQAKHEPPSRKDR